MKIKKKTLIKLIKEQYLNESKIINAKKGDSVWRVMERDNPQLGIYYVFDLRKIINVSANSISLDDNMVYNKSDGTRKGKSTSSYGSATYEIMDHEDAKRYYEELKSAGERVRGFQDSAILKEDVIKEQSKRTYGFGNHLEYDKKLNEREKEEISRVLRSVNKITASENTGDIHDFQDELRQLMTERIISTETFGDLRNATIKFLQDYRKSLLVLVSVYKKILTRELNN